MHILYMNNLSDVIDIKMETIEDKREYIKQLSRKVVDLIYQPCDITDMIKPGALETYNYCICQQGKKNTLIIL